MQGTYVIMLKRRSRCTCIHVTSMYGLTLIIITTSLVYLKLFAINFVDNTTDSVYNNIIIIIVHTVD